MSSNLPPGCNESDLPGNRPEDNDVEWERFHDYIDEICTVRNLTPEDARMIWDMGEAAWDAPRESKA